jgi:hypothetical protein
MNSSKIKTRIEKITPAKAEKYLALMGKNRRLRKRLVDRYTEAMKAGLWSLTGDPIRFNTKGELFDGQHRLQAVIQSGVSIETIVMRNVPDDAFMDIDTGGVRNPGDLLNLSGYSYANRVASAIRMASSILEIEAGHIKPSSFGRRRIPPQRLLEWAEAHNEELVRSARLMSNKVARIPCAPPALFAALHFLFSQYNPKGADQFFDMLIKGIGFEHGENDPVYQLRNMLIGFRSDKHRSRPAFYKAALAIKAWNAFQNRDYIGQLKYSENESWPEINRRKTRLSEAQAEKRREKKQARNKQVRSYDQKYRSKKGSSDSKTTSKKKTTKKTTAKKTTARKTAKPSTRKTPTRNRRAAATKSKPSTKGRSRK